jgi:hypothetical protein
MGFKAGMDRCGKSRPTGLQSRAVHPLDSRYIYCDIRLTEYTVHRGMNAQPKSSGAYVHFNKNGSKTNLNKCNGLKYDLQFGLISVSKHSFH